MVHNPITQIVLDGTIQVWRLGSVSRYAATARNTARIQAVLERTEAQHEAFDFAEFWDVRPDMHGWGPTYEEMRPVMAAQREQDEQDRESRQATSDGLWRRGW
jgi:hypothetical protein